MSLKVAKQFFANHPSVIVVHHWRKNEIPAANMESMFGHPRTVAKVGSRKVTFKHLLGVSELDLAQCGASVEGDILHLTFGDNPEAGPHISYRAHGEG